MIPIIGQPNVPIIGQPTVEDWHFTFTIKCAQCGTTTMLVGTPGTTRGCKNEQCDTVFRLLSLPTIEQGSLMVPIGTASKAAITAALGGK